MITHDYSSEVHLSRFRLLRYCYWSLGSLFVALGTLGIFLPVLPTTPFLLLAAACYAKSSARFYNWLLNNRYFGKFIRDWRNERKIPRKAKIVAITMITLTLGSSILFVIPLVQVKVLLGAIGLAVSTYILRCPSV